MIEDAFILWSVVMPGVLAGVCGLASAWLIGRRAGKPRLAAAVAGLLLAGCALLGFTLDGDLRSVARWPKFDRPSFILLSLPLSLLPFALLLAWRSRWTELVVWLVAAGIMLLSLVVSYRWQAKEFYFGDGSATWWLLGTLAGAVVFAWSLTRAAGDTRWRSVAVMGVTAFLVAPFAVFQGETSSALTLGILTAIIIGGGVGAGIGGVPIHAQGGAILFSVTMALVLSMSWVGPVADAPQWASVLLLTIAFVPWAVVTLLPLVGRSRLIGEVVGAVLAVVLLGSGVGLAADNYLNDGDATVEAEDDADPYGAF